MKKILSSLVMFSMVLSMVSSVPLKALAAVDTDDACKEYHQVIVSSVGDTVDGTGSAVATSFEHDAWVKSATLGDGADWIWNTADVSDATADQTDTFTKTIDVDGETVVSASIKIAADNGFRLKVNGDVVADKLGDEHNYESLATYPLTLDSGDNVLEIVVKNFAQTDGTPATNPAGLLYKITIDSKTCENDTPETATLEAKKIVCPLESDLPNWGVPEHSDYYIADETAAQYVAAHPTCKIVPWTFEWSLHDNPNVPDDNQEAGGEGWTPFTTTTTIPVGPAIWAREQMNDDYIPFSGYNPEDQEDYSNVSAEFYCSTDVASYDNVDMVGWSEDPIVAGETYHCLGFNVKKEGTTNPTDATISAKKVVCDSEADLPNWGAGHAAITATTASDYVTASEGKCHLTDWTYEWATSSTLNPGDNLEVGGAGWTPFAGTVSIPAPTNPAYVWVREQLPSTYIPFSGDITVPIDQNVSAEFYCGTDVLHYDNYDRVDDMVAGQTYNCVGFNVLKERPQEPSCDASANLITNGGFESPVVTNAALWDIFPSGTATWLASWVNPTGAPATVNIEIQKDGLSGWSATSAGGQWSELDADWGGPSSSQSGEAGSVAIMQDISTVVGQNYKVTFDFSPRPGTGAAQNKVEVWEDANLVGATSAVAGGANTAWTPYSFSFTASDTTTTITLRNDLTNPNDSLGSFVDNVGVHCVKGDDTTEPKEVDVTMVKYIYNGETTVAATAGNTTSATFPVDVTWNSSEIGTGGGSFDLGPTNDTPYQMVENALVAGDYFTVAEDLGTECNANNVGQYVLVGYKIGNTLNDALASATVSSVSLTDIQSDKFVVIINKKCGEVPPDACPNIDGYQATVPSGQHKNTDGNCVDDTTGGDKPVCSDTNDNDEDGKVDAADPGCHTDGDANNAGTYDPEDNSETDVTGGDKPQCSDGADNDGDNNIDSQDPGCYGGGDSYDPNDDDETNTPPAGPTGKTSSSHHVGSSHNAGLAPAVLGAETSCGIYVDKFLRKGYKNNMDAVKKVQQFLNDYTQAGLTMDGIYGAKTEAAVKAFQLAHADKILTPWGINLPTGIFYLTTQTEVNNIMCPTLALPIPENLVNFTPAVI